MDNRNEIDINHEIYEDEININQEMYEADKKGCLVILISTAVCIIGAITYIILKLR